jgi:PST family polysaccharide transporter
VSTEPQKSYGQILKSSALVGGSSLLNNVFALVRSKGLAVMLGPGGFGLFALYNSVVDVTRTIAGLGINTSGVRQIAEAVGSGDEQRVARTIFTLRRVALVSGTAGGLLLLVLCQPVSQLTFGSLRESGAVALLALAAFLGDVSAGQSALIQGMRRITELAKINVLGALYGTVFGLIIIYFRRDDWGVVVSLVCVAAMGTLTSWWYARRISIQSVGISFRQVRLEASGLLKLGVVFMASALMTFGAAYLIRIIIRGRIGMEAVGFYMAAWNWGGQYVGIILQAMGADFYPRLTAVASDHAECNRLVNEQSEVGLLMAGPGILATLTLAPLVIIVFYSGKFGPAAPILRWICLGMMLRVVSWPIGWIVLAKGARKVFFWTELFSNAFYAGLLWLGLLLFGLPGTGIAFFVSCLVNVGVVYAIARHMTGFHWSRANRRLALLFLPLVAAVFAAGELLNPIPAAVVGLALTAPAGYYALKMLCKLVPLTRLPRAARKVVRLLRLAPAGPEPAPDPALPASERGTELLEKESK